MSFKRNKIFDELIVQIKKDKKILVNLDYEELEIFVTYLMELNDYLKETKGED